MTAITYYVEYIGSEWPRNNRWVMETQDKKEIPRLRKEMGGARVTQVKEHTP